MLLKMHAHFEKHGDINPEQIVIIRRIIHERGMGYCDPENNAKSGFVEGLKYTV